jgi:hypothetical protein
MRAGTGVERFQALQPRRSIRYERTFLDAAYSLMRNEESETAGLTSVRPKRVDPLLRKESDPPGTSTDSPPST